MVMAYSIIQITNIAHQATKDQMETLFAYIGKIDDLRLYPERDSSAQTKCCFVKFRDPEDAGVALHLNNTVFIDKALTIARFKTSDKIPSEDEGLRLAAGAPHITTGSKFPRWPPNVTNTVVGVGPGSVVNTHDPKFEALGLAPYPSLPANTDPIKIDEIRRSVYAGNLDAFVTAEQLMEFFGQAGEIMYVRMAGDQTQPTRFAFIEFSHQSSIATALSFNGMMFMGRALKVNHSNSAITKPQQPAPTSSSKDLDEAMRRVKEADKLISAAIETPTSSAGASVFQRKLFGLSTDMRRPSPSRRRSRSPRRPHRSRSPRPKHRSSRRRSRSRDRPRHSREHERRPREVRRSRSRERRRERSRRGSPHRRHSSRDRHELREHRSGRSREHRKKSRRSPSGSRSKKERKRKSPSPEARASSDREQSYGETGQEDSLYNVEDASSGASSPDQDDLMDAALIT